MKVLIVDDRPLGARKLRDDILAAEPNYQVKVAATDGAITAADRAKQIVQEASERFDVFLIDDNMGVGPNGSDLMTELAQLSPSSEAIIFTAYADEEGKRRAIEAGARAYVPRPVNEKELLWQLRGIQKDQSTRRERDWLQLLAATTTKELQEATTIQDAGQAIVNGAQQLGFQRARLRMVCGGQDEQIEMIGVSQMRGDSLIDDFTTTKRLLKNLPYSRKVLLETKYPTLFRGRELGSAPWDMYITPPLDEWFKVPLFVGDRPIGTLSLDNGAQPCKYTSDDRQQMEQLLDLFGKQAAAALERAKFQEQVVVLSDIGRIVTTKAAQGNPDALLEEVRQQVKRLMDVNNFMVVLTDPDTDLLDFRLNYEGDEPLLRQWRDPEQGLAGYLIQENKPLWLPNATEATFREQHQIPPYGQMSQCWLGVPLHVDERGAIGALVVQHYENPQQYNEDHQRLLEAVAKQIAGAIDLVVQREREVAYRHSIDFLNEIRKRLADVLQEKEDWFWHLLLKFITDECGLRFNRAVIFLSNSDGDSLQGQFGVGQLVMHDVRQRWERLGNTRSDFEEECDLDRFLDYLRNRQPADHTPIEQLAPVWTLSATHGTLMRIRESGVPESVPQDQWSSLPEAYRKGLENYPRSECVAAPMVANGRFLGMVLADNAFSNEPMRWYVQEKLAEILNYAALLWERQDARRRELNSAQREQLAGLRAQTLQAIQRQGLQAGLEFVCRTAQEMMQVESVVVYPLTESGVAYLNDQITQVGLNSEKANRDFAIRPRQHGIFAYVKRVGKVMISDVAGSDLSFDNQPLYQHSFILSHGIRAFIGLALRSRSTGDTLGVMYFNSNVPRHFTSQEETLAVELGDIAVLAITTARGSIEIVDQQRTQELNRLRYVLEAALSPDANDANVISVLLANTAELLPATDCAELMVSRWASETPVNNTEWRVNRTLRGEPFAQTHEVISASKTAKQAFTERRLISVPYPRQPDEEGENHGKAAERFSVLAAPVYHNKQVVGVLRVTAGMADGFAERDRVRISELASAAGLVVGSLRRRQGLLNAVLQAVQEVTRPSSLREVLETIVDQARIAAPELDCVTLWYRQPETGTVVAGPFWGVRNPDFREGEPTEAELVRTIMNETKPVWARDVQQLESFRGHELVERDAIVSAAVFPLRDEEESVGALFFNYRKLHDFTSEERYAFPIFAGIAAASIRDAQLNEAAKRGEKRLLAALAVAKAAGALWERNQVMRAILTALRDHFGQYSANASPYLLLYNADDQMLELPEEAREFYPALQVLDSSKPIRLPLDAPRIASKVARRCLDEKRVVVVSFPDVTEEEDYEAPDATTRSELCAGLWRDGNLLGVLVLKSQQINAFTKEDEQLFELVTEQVAAALERANQVAEKRFNDYLTGAMAWASDIAHDINVDISYIRYRAYWLREREPGITAQGKQWAKEIDDRAGQLAHKARDESSERSKVPLEVGAFLEKKVREWQPRACPNTKISYEWADAELPALVYPEQVWRAVRHLLRNALEAMNYKGHIWLRARPFGSEQVELQVENSGADIPFEVRQRLFREPYSTKSVGGGMGLLIAKMLIEVMDGAISLLPPEEGRGPVFAIRLPQADQPWERQDDLA